MTHCGRKGHWSRALEIVGFTRGSAVKNLPAMPADLGLIPGLGRSLGGGLGSPLQYS